MKYTTTQVKGLMVMLCAILLSANSFGQLRISQVYGGGGNSGAPYTRDFVELFNAGSSPIVASNYSIQYASATGSSWTVQSFSATIPAGGYFLIALAVGAGAGVALPTPDISGSIAMSGTAGKVALSNSNVALTGTCPTVTVIDFVGFGSTANCFEGAGPTPAPSNSLSVSRGSGGCLDAGNNNSDFTSGAPNPRNSASPINSCALPPTVTTDPATVTASTDATLNGTVNANGGSSVVTFQYGTTIGYGSTVTATPSPVTGVIATSVSAGVTGLSVNTLYNYRVVATAATTVNGSNATFYTFANVPSVPTVVNPSSSSLDVSITATDGNPSTTEYAIQETGSTNYVQASGALGASAVWQTASAWGTKTVTGLTSSTSYIFQVKARNGALVETAFGLTGSGTTSASGSPTITVAASLTPFTTVAGVASASQNYTVSGSFLTNDITLTPPVDFEISTDNSTWVSNPSTITLTQSGGNVALTTIYVHLNSAVAGTFSGSIDHSTIGGGSQTLAVSGTALALEPLTASTVSFGATGATTMTINFVSGSGPSRIVVLKAGSAVGFIPTDGSAASGVNADFSLAVNQGSGDRIVYDGTGNTVNVTGLSSSTTYHVAVYEYNGTLVTSNYLATPGTGSNPTTTLEPTNASTLTFGTITDISMVLNFTGGNGTSRIVVAHENSAVTFGPADLTSYTGINSDFSLAVDQGAGDKIVYDGTGTTVTVTGLTVGNTYFYKVYEYNGSGLLTNYLLTPNGSNSNSTVGPVPYSVTGSTYSQAFNGLPSAGTFAVPTTGFPFYVASSPVSATGMVGWQYGVVSGTPRFGTTDGTGVSAPTASVYSTGTAANSERSLGAIASGSNTSNIGLVLSNTTSDILNTVTITFKGEQWRRGSGSANVLSFKYSVGGSSLNSGTFTTEPTLNFVSPVTTGTNIGLDGNIAPNFTNVSATFTLNANWMPGQTLVLRWDDAEDPLNDDLLSIDDFTFVATGPQTPTTQDNNISFSGTLTNATSVNWINGDGTNRIVVMNTTNSFTNPVDGSSFTANTVYGGGEQVVYNGTGSTVNVTNLSPSTQYFFRVYGYNGTGLASKFNTTTATLNPNDVTTADPSFPTQLVVLNVNNGTDVIVNQPFTITIQAQDNFGSPQNVTQNTTIDLSVFVGFGGLFSGTTSGIMTAGTNQITITGVVYDLADFGVVLNAATSAGDILFDGQTPSFDVFDIATQVAFVSTPTNGVVNSIVNTFYVHALRPDFSVDQYYVGSATIAYSSGPGTVTGTLTAPFVNGIATFSDIVFSQVGTYVLEASSGFLVPALSPSILINPPVSFTELVVPKYMGSKSAAGTNTDRTPIAVCVQIDYLAPNTLYNLAAGFGLTSEANTALGAGTIWNGTAFSSQVRNGAFTTDANGSSGPVWIYLQPSGNATRFSAGEVHNIRIAYSAGTFGTIVPNFVTTKTITSLDIASTALTTTTLDDGAFLTGALSACIGGKHILVYDNTLGTGDPLYSYVANPGPTQPTQTTLPVSVDQIFMGTAAAGTFAAVYPIGANGPNGVRRVEARNADNTISAFETSATGIWPGGTNTTNALRREVKALTNIDVNLSSITVSTSSTNLTCFGVATGTATATASSLNSPITYLWSPVAETTSSISSLAAGTYVVTATDGIGCTASSTVIVTQPADIFIVGQVTNTGCVGGDIGAVDITVGGGTAPFTYSWSNGPITEDITGLSAGTYTVTVTDANSCSKSETFTVITQNTSPTITVTATPSSICAGQSSTLEATGATTYTWSPSGSLSSSTDPIVTATPTTTTTYSVVAVDGFGCQSIGTVTLTVNPLPVVVVTPATSSICEGSSVSLSATGASTYDWSPITGLSATTGSPVVATPSASTVYTVIGTSVDNCTASATASITVSSVAAPTVSSPVNYCQNATATALTATALPGNDLWWYTTSTGGNAATVAPIPSTVTPGSTTYYVSQQQSNPLSIAINGYIDNTTPDSFAFVSLSKIPAGTVIYFTDNGYATIPVAPATAPGFRGASAFNAKGNEDMVKLTAINTIPEGTVIRSYVSTADFVWTFSGPITCSTCTTANNYAPLSISTSGDQVYAFISSTNDNPLFNTAQQTHLYVFDDSNGFEQATTAATGAIPPGLSAGVTANTFAFSSSGFVKLNNDLQTRSVAAWRTYMSLSANYSIGAGAGTGLPSTNLNVDLGCESPRTPITVIVNPAPVVDAVALTPILCNGGTSTVMVTASGATVPYTGEGTFTVVAGTYNYTVSDANGCLGSASVTVTEPTAIVVTATETSAIVCPGGTATITVTATGGTGAYTGEGTFTVLAGTYNYTVTDINGCPGTTSITVSDPPAVGVTNFTPSTGCVGSTVSIFGSNLNLVTAIDLNGISAIFVLVNPGEITVTVPPTATSGVFNLYTAANCTTSTTSSFIVTNCSTGMTVNLNLFLEGYYTGSSTMVPALMNEFVVGATSDQTDTITVDLWTWDGVTAGGQVFADSTKAILMTNGTATATFTSAPAGSYYIGIRHRSSVLTWSSAPVTMGSSPASYNFANGTNGISEAYGDNMSDKFNEGIYSFFCGDINQDGFVDIFDYNTLDFDTYNFLGGDYYTTDLNGDGFVDIFDYNDIDRNTYNFIGSIHP